MGESPYVMVRGDEILVNDVLGLGGVFFTVLSNSKERGEGFITMQLSSMNAVTKESIYAELTVSIDSLLFVTRQ
jgi:hypothetical protein